MTRQDGDFSSAGSIYMQYKDKIDKGFYQVTGGSFAYGRALAVVPYQDFGGGSAYGAVEAQYYNGPWERGDNLRRINSVLRWARGTQEDGAAVTFMGYANRWYSTDQIPERAVYIGREVALGHARRHRRRRHHPLLALWPLEPNRRQSLFPRRSLCHAFDARSLQQLHLLPLASGPWRPVPSVRPAHHGRRQRPARDQMGQFRPSGRDPHRSARSLRRHSLGAAGKFPPHAL